MTSGTHWTDYEKNLFELALIMYPKNDPYRWKKIANLIPGKSAVDVKEHYDPLVHDIQSESEEFNLLDCRNDVPENHIEQKLNQLEFELMNDFSDDFSELTEDELKDFEDSEKHISSGPKQIQSESEIKKRKPSTEDEQKGRALYDSENNILSGPKQNKSKSEIKNFKRSGRWTDDEQKLLLEGVEVYGRGNWAKIAREFVTTRTPRQVKHHAHYYFIMNPEKDTKPSSSHGTSTDDSSQS